jgi:hypothetical protein
LPRSPTFSPSSPPSKPLGRPSVAGAFLRSLRDSEIQSIVERSSGNVPEEDVFVPAADILSFGILDGMNFECTLLFSE